MLVDILFVLAVIGILIAIYKTKFSKTKSAQELKAEVVRQLQMTKKKSQRGQSQRPQRIEQRPSPVSEWRGEQGQNSSSQDQQQQNSSSAPQNMRKQLYKQQKKRQKKQQKQSQQHFLQQQKQKRQQYQKQIYQKEQEQQQKRQKQQQYIQQMRQDERKRKQQEFNKWKDLFEVEESGINMETEDVLVRKQRELENALVEYLIRKKLTLLEDASHRFSLTTKDLVQKIKKLEMQNRVSGVFDERGKYLYIEQKQWDSVKSYILAKGRLKKTDMMTQCARIIKIPEGTDEDLVKLINEVQSQ